MACAVCGSEICANHDGPAEVAPTAPRLRFYAWQILAFTVIGLALLYIVACGVRIVVLNRDYHLIGQLAASPGPYDYPPLRALSDQDRIVNLSYLAAFMFCAAGAMTWFVIIARLAHAFGQAGSAAVSHWSRQAWIISVLGSIVVGQVIPDNPTATVGAARQLSEASAFVLGQIVFTSCRIAVTTLLIIAIWMAERRLRTVAAASPSHEHLDGEAYRTDLFASFRRWRERRQGRVYY